MSNAKSRDTRAQAGEFTNLWEFIPDINLPTQELEPVIEKWALKFRNKKVKRSIDSFSNWLSAWNNYEKLVAYRDLIQNCLLDATLYATIFDATAVLINVENMPKVQGQRPLSD